MKEEVNTRQLFIGFNILVLGAIFYYCFRSAEHTYFLKFFGTNSFLKDSLSPFFVLFGNILPTFIHVFAFIMMTASLAANRKRGYLIVTLAWFTVDVLFEIGQGFGNSVIQIIPNWFSDFLFLENTLSMVSRYIRLRVISGANWYSVSTCVKRLASPSASAIVDAL